MRVKAKRTKDGFLIPLINELKDKDEILVEIKEDVKTQHTEKYIKETWREIGMNTHSANRNDDEYLYEAAWEFYNEKHSD